MNAIGQFGRFITEYQNPIQIVLVIIVLAAAIYAAARAVINARQKREILSQINEKVTEINTAVNHLNEKKTDVIYIDNRVPGQAPYEEKPRGEDIVREAPPASEAVKPQDNEEADEASIDMQQEIQPEADAQPCQQDPAEDVSSEEEHQPKKYFSRDCAISKNGRTYTIEELNQQIKE